MKRGLGGEEGEGEECEEEGEEGKRREKDASGGWGGDRSGGCGRKTSSSSSCLLELFMLKMKMKRVGVWMGKVRKVRKVSSDDFISLSLSVSVCC